MEAYFSFLMQHWMLSSTFILLLILVLLNEWRHRTYGIPGISNQQLVDLLNHSGGVVVDIRPQQGFIKAHILGALNVPQAELAQRVTSLGKYKAKPLIVVCSNGNEAPKICKLLQAAGFEKLQYLKSGMQGWVQEGMPTTNK
jgi:rhodanese-related sulfurtransferase